MLVATKPMSGMVNGRIDRPLCHSHSAAMAIARDLLGTASAARLGVLSVLPSNATPHPPPFSTCTTSTVL